MWTLEVERGRGKEEVKEHGDPDLADVCDDPCKERPDTGEAGEVRKQA
jgi:hypothetical protein